MTTEPMSIEIRERDACVHHWIVEAANGPTSNARCKHCGKQRTFFNNPEAALEKQ